MLKVALMSALILVLASATAPPEEAVWLERGADVVRPFKQQLKSELIEGMKKGAVNAIEVCSMKAPAIADSITSEDLLVGRTSHKVRNPSNSPQPWVEPLLQAYLDDPNDRSPKVVALENGRVGYVEPINTQPVCLTYHGSSIEEATRAAITKLYPDDQATGFDKDDLRGLFWVEFNGE